MKLSTFFVALILFFLPVTWAQQWVIQIPEEPSVGIIEGIVGITCILLRSLIDLILSLFIMLWPLGLLFFFGAVLSSIWKLSLRPFRDFIDNLYGALKDAQEESPLHPMLLLLVLFTIPLGLILVLALIESLFTRVVSFLKPEITVSAEDHTREESSTEGVMNILDWAKTITDLILPLLPFFFFFL